MPDSQELTHQHQDTPITQGQEEQWNCCINRALAGWGKEAGQHWLFSGLPDENFHGGLQHKQGAGEEP